LAGAESVDDGAVPVDDHASAGEEVDRVCLLVLPNDRPTGGYVDGLGARGESFEGDRLEPCE